jgi:hypothetical protein
MVLKSTRGHLLAFVMFKSYTKPKKSNQIKQQVHAHSLNTKRGYYIIMSCHTIQFYNKLNLQHPNKTTHMLYIKKIPKTFVQACAFSLYYVPPSLVIVVKMEMIKNRNDYDS